MAFVDYELFNQAYPDGRMKENVLRLKDYDVFHCLFRLRKINETGM